MQFFRIRHERALFRRVIFSAFFICFFLLTQDIYAQPPANDGANQDTYVVLKKKIKDLEKQRDDMQKQIDNSYGAVKRDFSSAGIGSVPKAETARIKSAEQIKNVNAFIAAARRIENEIQTTGKNEAARNAKIRELQTVLDAAKYTMTPIVFHSEILEDLRSRAEISRANEDVTAARLAFGEYSREEDGGGVYINETAAVPLPRSRISLVQYDTACNRFVLHAGDKRFWTPPMDPERTAVAIQCLDDRETEPKQLAMSFDIHPVTMKRVISGIYGYQSVLFNCPHLEDTELGSILIDADKLLESIWMGKNREGDNLTKKHHYHSLAQMALDHPAIAAIIQKKPAAQIDMGMRWWIRPAPVKMHLSGDTLAFGDISFRMFTETVRFQDPRWFKGEFVPNPGADAFCRYFNDHYPSFEDFVGRIDDHTGREIRPFKELKEVVKIVAFLRWVIGASGETGITMDTSWAYRYGVKKVRTPGDVISIALHNVESEIQPPIQIYNQYGLSRVIDRNGRTTWFKYDGNGQLKSITSDR